MYRFRAFLLLAFALSAVAAPLAASPIDGAFMAQINTAMNAMMTHMAIHPSGDVDKDFVATMVPHHEGAMKMAEAELRYGHSEQLKRIAQEIIVTQQQEIAAMHLALGQPLPPSEPAPDQPSNMEHER